jgi:PKD repeat protein
VYIQNPAVGTWTVEVAGSNVPQAPQPFALVVTGDFGPPPEPPTASFSGSPTSGDALLNVSFTDESTGVITAWAWDFGDLGTSTLQDPSHIYKEVGVYTVSLTVTGPGGSDTETMSNYISVLNPPKRIYLPLILKAYAPPLPDDPIVNGDFEDGPWAGWIEDSTNNLQVVVEDGFFIEPHSEQWLAWLGGFAEEESYVEQTVTVPSGRSYLHYWHWISSSNTNCTTEQAVVLVNGSAVRTYALCSSTRTWGWVEQVVDLESYAGQSASLQFQATTAADASSWYIDDVSFQFSAAMADVSLPVAPDSGIPIARKVKPAPELSQP